MTALFVLEPETFHILEVNPAGEELLGLPAARMIGRPLSQWVQDPSRNDFLNALSVAARGGGSLSFRVVVRDGEARSLNLDTSVSREGGRLQMHFSIRELLPVAA